LDPNNLAALSRNQANDEDTILDRYLTNRYQYGLNSAGVYIYARDSSPGGGVVNEILTLPSRNLHVTPEESLDSVLRRYNGKTALIRPVSDERGFEVIGHFQYGRRIYLKDGRLITHAPNTRATVDLQLALSGDVHAMLTAQSQGLTTVSTGMADPASTVASLRPEDLQTAAVLNPDTSEPEFTDVGDRFVSTGTLDSEEQAGAPVSVEASQLSRALTLAEMSVRDSSTMGDENCVCLTGRQDLAFINSGYQVKTIEGSTPDEIAPLTNLEAGSGPINSGATLQAQSAVDLAQAELNAAQATLSGLEADARGDPDSISKSQLVLDQERAVREAQGQLETAQEALDSLQARYQSSNSIFTQPTSELIARVDQFLANLYQVLDTPHQEFEKAVRGELLPKTPRETDFNGVQVSPPSEFAPPFSAPNRFQLGDPEATVGAFETNVANLDKSWREFGDRLRANAERTKVATQISQDRASIARLTNARDRLAQQQQSSVVIGTDLSASIASLDEQIARLERDVANNQAKLSAV
jgi:hypothetical protein